MFLGAIGVDCNLPRGRITSTTLYLPPAPLSIVAMSIYRTASFVKLGGVGESYSKFRPVGN